jgi:Mg-chelatase subunit ChlD
MAIFFWWGLLIIIGGAKKVIGQPAYLGLKENLGSLINNRFDQIAPFFSHDGKGIYFAQNSHPDGYYEIWEAQKGNLGNWQQAIVKSNLQAPLMFNQTVFGSFKNDWFLINGRFQIKNGVTLYEKGFSWYQAKSPGFDPTKALPLEIEELETMMQGGFANIFYHPQKKILLLSVAHPDKRDLFISRPVDSTEWPIIRWQKPIPLPASINTPAEESCPYLDASGKILYFSSNRPGGYGSDDIYMSFSLSEDLMQWSPPVNLGFRVNSNFSELYYNAPANEPYAYFVSYKHSMGAGDIFRIQVPDSIPVSEINVTNIQDNSRSIVPTTGYQESSKPISAEKNLSTTTNVNPATVVTDSAPNQSLTIKPGQLPIESYLPNNLTLLLDKSVSMSQNNRIGLLQKSASILLNKLRYLDRVGLVTFGEKTNVLYVSHSFQAPDTLLQLIQKIKPDEGETFINDGIQKAMALALDQYMEGANNEIMIITDGYFSIANRTMELLNKNPQIKISFVLVDAGSIETNIKNYIQKQLPTAYVLTLTNHKKDEEVLLEHIKAVSAISR